MAAPEDPRWSRAVVETALAAAGRTLREDPATAGSGGPAGNARLTAWTGLVLLAGFAVEGFTLLSVRQMISVHILVGTLLLPLVLLKTGTTGWRILRYYTGNPSYRRAGPPPLLLRVLGPLVVLTGIAVLATGLVLIWLGDRSFDPFLAFAGFEVNAITVHQAAFIGWLVIVGLHVLARTVPAWRLATGREDVGAGPGGGWARFLVIMVTLAAAVALGVAVLQQSGVWTHTITFGRE